MKGLLAGALTIALTTALAIVGSPAAAQDAAPGASSANSSMTLGEVVVTAQKRSENVQKVAAAISAVNRAQIEQARIQTNSDLHKLAPSVQVTTYFNIPSINIRGLGNEASNPSGDASVATYIDGVYQARPTATTAAFEDLDRIEVLRGPQGTLYGRNTTGGVVNLITRMPTDVFQANVYASYGSYNDAKLTGAVGGPLTSAWDTSARLTFFHDSNSGTMINIANGNHTNKMEADGGRLTIVTHPTNNVRITLRGDYYKDRLDGDSPQIIACEPYSDAILSSPCNPGGNLPNAAAINATLGIAKGAPTNPPATGIYYFNNLDGIHYGFNGQNWVTHSSYGGSITLDWSITPDISLKSISAYRWNDYNEANDADGSTSNYISFYPGFEEGAKQVSQEVDVNGSFPNGAVWSVGAFGFGEDIRGTYLGMFPAFDVEFFGDPTLNPSFTNQDALHTRSYSAYAQATAPLTDQLKITAGVRENYDDRRVVSDVHFGPLGVLTDCSGQVYFANTTYKVGLDYQMTPRNMLYATVSTGFKAGGVNEGVDCSSPYSKFSPENLTAYELGSKNLFLDGRLLINADVYFYDYKGYQADVLTNSTVEIVNAANAIIGGVEFEVQAKPIEHLTLTGNAGFSHNEFQHFVSANPIYAACPAAGGPPECQQYLGSLAPDPLTGGLGENLTGKHLPHSPQWTGNGQAEYVIPLTAWDESDLRLHYDFSYSSGWFGDIFNEAITTQKPYTIHNASIAFTHKGYEIGAFVDNFTNALYAEAKYQFSTASAAEVNWAPLRRWGVYVKASW